MANKLHHHYYSLLSPESPWKITDINLQIEERKVVIKVEHPTSKATCPDCGRARNIKDHAAQRQWRHLDTMDFQTIIQTRISRAHCQDCRIKTIDVTWASKHSRFTLIYEAFAVEVLESARSLEAGRKLLGISWDTANTLIKRAVERGISKRDISEVEQVGINEKSFLLGHKYITSLNDLDKSRVLDVVPEHTESACRDLILKALPTPCARQKIKAVTMDMWSAFDNAKADLLSNAEVVYVRYHISSYLSGAVDKVRRAEYKQLMAEGDRSLTGTRYSWLRSEATRTQKHNDVLEQLCGRNPRTSKAWAIKESFQEFWSARNEGFGELIFKSWYGWAVRFRLDPIAKVARTFKRHHDRLMRCFHHPISNAVSEWLNSKIQSIKALSQGSRDIKNYRNNTLFICSKLDLSLKIAH